MPHYYKELFITLLAITGIFILIEISFFIQCNKFIFDFVTLSDLPIFPMSSLPNIILFVFLELLIHFLFCILIWALTLMLLPIHSTLKKQVISIGVILWCLSITMVLLANQIYFPNSKYSELTRVLFPDFFAKIIFSALIFSALLLFILISFHYLKQIRLQFLIPSVLILGIATLTGSHYLNQNSAPKTIVSFKKPNVIIIGIDSLRPDFLSYFGAKNKTIFLDSFLTNASVFNQAITPIARTFPSWIALLSGQYPKHNTIRTNLANQDRINISLLLPHIFQKNGYETIYASDETRFSNITNKLGFDRVITPPIGLNDFLIGSLSDFPLSNLLINSPLGHFLFPYSYGNRPAHITYQPNQFLSLLRPFLNETRTKPLFFAIHFCLPHFPYLAASLYAADDTMQERYRKSIQLVDHQVEQFFTLLKSAGLLENTIVVLLSDHGEALELPGDRITDEKFFMGIDKPIPLFYPKSLKEEELNQSAGHGTDVLSLSQYHTLLAIKTYGKLNKSLKAGLIPDQASLIDVKPTLLDLANIKWIGNGDGRSLINTTQISTNPAKRHLFLESDFTPESIRTIYPEMRKVVLDNIQYFQIDPKTTYLTIKDHMEIKIIKSKQYADLYDNWLLALYPQNNKQYIAILVNLKSREWTNNLQSHFAKASPAQIMLDKLRIFYSTELASLELVTQTKPSAIQG